MKKILMRMGKDPFEVVSAEKTLKKNLLGTNIGNALFQVASHKLLTTKDSEVIPYKFTPSLKDVEWANENFDMFVIPLANAFRISFKKSLDKHTEFIKKLNIPVLVLGVGVQAEIECNDFSHLEVIKESVKNFCDAVLEKSKSIGVRGACTKKYLLSLGYKEEQIDIIGCPSMFWHGDEIFIHKKSKYIYNSSKISFNLSPYAKYSKNILLKVIKFFDDVVYIPQNNSDLEQILYRNFSQEREIDRLLYKYFYSKNKVIFFNEPKTWIDFLKTRDFSIGTRIHGTIASIIAGTPAHIFVHDSRTKELAEYFEIPFTPISEIENINLYKLYEDYDYSNIIKNHKTRFEKVEKFLKKHNINHIFEEQNIDVLKKYENKYFNLDFKSNKLDYSADVFEKINNLENIIRKNETQTKKELNEKFEKINENIEKNNKNINNLENIIRENETQTKKELNEKFEKINENIEKNDKNINNLKNEIKNDLIILYVLILITIVIIKVL